MNAPITTIAPSAGGLDDSALETWLLQRLTVKDQVSYLQGQYICKVHCATANDGCLLLADPGAKSLKILKKLASSRLLQHIELPATLLSGSSHRDPAWHFLPTTTRDISRLHNDRQSALGREAGRGSQVSKSTAWRVWADAGGRCMFAGCGEDLGIVPLYNKSAQIGYLAHIVASDPLGPRGTQADSHRLSDVADNIMLMCDAHHRLIDCFEAERYTAAALNEMRRDHVSLVQSALSSLQRPRVKAVTLFADLGGVSTHIPDSDLQEAISATQGVMLPEVFSPIRRTQRDDRRSPSFWVNYLSEHELEIQLLMSVFRSPATIAASEVAIFPLHHIPTLVLAGRIIGEARNVRVFQRSRQRQSFLWSETAEPMEDGAIWHELPNLPPTDEVLITVELTAKIDSDDLPASLSHSVKQNGIPWIRIRIQRPNPECISHPTDLDQFRKVAREAIGHAQDTLRARTVHLIAIAPASTIFCFGQMLQAGNHSVYVVYDRPIHDQPFREAIRIEGHRTSAHAEGASTSINIR